MFDCEKYFQACIVRLWPVKQLWHHWSISPDPRVNQHRSINHTHESKQTATKWGQLSTDSLNLLFMGVNYELFTNAQETFINSSAAAPPAGWKTKRKSEENLPHLHKEVTGLRMGSADISPSKFSEARIIPAIISIKHAAYCTPERIFYLELDTSHFCVFKYLTC